jgi:hypothetical protein
VPTALDVVDGEVREPIRRRGLDPFTDPGPVRVLVRDVVADYSERSLPPTADAESVVRDVLDRVAGFGPLQRYLDDPEIEEIWVNEPGRVFIARWGRSELTTTILAPGELADLVERMLRTSGRRVDMSTPFVDAMMPDGSRLHLVIPTSTRPAGRIAAPSNAQSPIFGPWHRRGDVPRPGLTSELTRVIASEPSALCQPGTRRYSRRGLRMGQRCARGIRLGRWALGCRGIRCCRPSRHCRGGQSYEAHGAQKVVHLRIGARRNGCGCGYCKHICIRRSHVAANCHNVA